MCHDGRRRVRRRGRSSPPFRAWGLVVSAVLVLNSQVMQSSESWLQPVQHLVGQASCAPCARGSFSRHARLVRLIVLFDPA